MRQIQRGFSKSLSEIRKEMNRVNNPNLFNRKLSNKKEMPKINQARNLSNTMHNLKRGLK